MSLQNAVELSDYGFNVLPSKIGQKTPYVKWKQFTDVNARSNLGPWFNGKELNYWVATGGISNIYVLDIDSSEGERWWREEAKLGELMDATVCVKTSKGHHYYFWVEDDDRSPGWSFHHEDISFDTRGYGQGVVAPPSIHASGEVYTWIREPDPSHETNGMVRCPDWLKSAESTKTHLRALTDTNPHENPQEPREVTGDTKESRGAVLELLGDSVRSMLSDLLLRVPKGGEGAGRNDWLTKIAGHYAKTYRNQQDLYLIHTDLANRRLDTPLDPQEYAKTVNSVWTIEHENHPERDIEQTGYLLSTGDSLLTQVKIGKGETVEYTMQEWADFDIKVHNVISDDTGAEIVYDATLTRKFDKKHIPVVLEGQTLGQPPKLSKWLGSHGVSIARPDATYPSGPIDSVRLLRYLNSQEAPRAEMVPSIGWNHKADGFLTFDGVIRPGAKKLEPFTSLRPNPVLKTNRIISANYGFSRSRAEAIEVLREVLTFHHEDVAAVFGSWWAACFLKPQLMSRLSLFPLMAIESASGAGKTNGMFNLMVRMNGNLTGPQNITGAAARDQISASNNTIVWIDDLDRLDRLEEMLRATTSGESLSKKDIDNSGNVTVKLVSPVIVSGEFLGLGSQKALMDRSVILNPPKPDGRTSLHDPSRPQWDDVVELTNRYPAANGQPGLSVFAGHYVQAALELAPDLDQKLSSIVRKVKRTTSGRQAEKISAVVAGSWVLDRMVNPELGVSEQGVYEQRLWEWSLGDEATSGSAGEWDNQLTTEILPWALRDALWTTDPTHGRAVFIEEDEGLFGGPVVWVNTSMLADEWRQHMNGRIMERTDSRKAILDQVMRCAPEGEKPKRKTFDVTRDSRRKQASFWKIEGRVAQVVIERSRGE